MTEKVYNVLFFCTGNSAHSIFGERLVERWGQDRFRGFSSDSYPRSHIHPIALKLKQKLDEIGKVFSWKTKARKILRPKRSA